MKLLKNIEWIFDYHFAWMMYNGYKTNQYNRYMIRKWGDKYKNKFK